VAERVRKAIEAAPGFKGRFLPDWERNGSVVVQLTGGNENAENAIKSLLETDAAKGEVTDPKSPSGKTTRRVLTFDLAEKYVFEEKPVYTFYLRKGREVERRQALHRQGRHLHFRHDYEPQGGMRSRAQLPAGLRVGETRDNDPYTVRFVWKKPYFLSFGVSGEMYILAEHVFRYDDAAEMNIRRRRIRNGRHRAVPPWKNGSASSNWCWSERRLLDGPNRI